MNEVMIRLDVDGSGRRGRRFVAAEPMRLTAASHVPDANRAGRLGWTKILGLAAAPMRRARAG